VKRRRRRRRRRGKGTPGRTQGSKRKGGGREGEEEERRSGTEKGMRNNVTNEPAMATVRRGEKCVGGICVDPSCLFVVLLHRFVGR
jgi:hypothetical protein